MAALADAYKRAGFTVEVLDVLKEPLNHAPILMDFGPVIALPDAVALKMGALHDRGLPRDLLDVYGAAAHFSGPELISLCRTALDDEFNLETLRDQLSFAAAHSDEAFARYGCAPAETADVKAWAQDWATEIGLDMAEAEPWTDDE
jgi:hypothetical protein